MAATTGSRHAIWAYIEYEHLELVRGINRIHEVAGEIGRKATPDMSADVLGVLRWFETTLEPHMAWEEAMLYPEVDRRAGTPWATRAARFDHQQIREELAWLRLGHRQLADHGAIDPQIDVRYRLHAMEALIRAHIEHEERFLIPGLNEELEPTRPGVTRSDRLVRGLPGGQV
jgi:iron-sulfur cluster repair protein YtfE (RIC family)